MLRLLRCHFFQTKKENQPPTVPNYFLQTPSARRGSSCNFVHEAGRWLWSPPAARRQGRDRGRVGLEIGFTLLCSWRWWCELKGKASCQASQVISVELWSQFVWKCVRWMPACLPDCQTAIVGWCASKSHKFTPLMFHVLITYRVLTISSLVCGSRESAGFWILESVRTLRLLIMELR